MKQPPYDIAVIDNLDVVRMGVTTLQITHPAIVRTVTTYAHADDVDLGAAAPDVVVLDYWLGRDDEASLDYIGALKAWSGRVVLYTSEEAPARLREAMQRGIDGLCLKNDGAAALADAIAAVGRGRFVCSGPLARAVVSDEALSAKLTPAEIRVLRALALGLSTADIALRLSVAETTVGTQVESIRRKYSDATGQKVNRVRLLREGMKDGYFDPPRVTKNTENT